MQYTANNIPTYEPQDGIDYHTELFASVSHGFIQGYSLLNLNPSGPGMRLGRDESGSSPWRARRDDLPGFTLRQRYASEQGSTPPETTVSTRLSMPLTL
jgi:hypothetical protein